MVWHAGHHGFCATYMGHVAVGGIAPPLPRRPPLFDTEHSSPAVIDVLAESTVEVT